MIISIIGSCGIVGSALEFGFKKLGHTVIPHDLKLDTSLENVLNTEICYVCVPTPANQDGSCNTEVVEKVVMDLHKINYRGTIVIKSTITPKTTDRLIKTHKNIKISHSCEFLRERSHITDFVELQRILVVGTYDNNVATQIIKSHGNYPWKTKIVSPVESEIIKLTHNSINALRIVFSNEIYEVCQKIGANYNEIKDAVLASTELPNRYLDVNDAARGYSSICLNKDIPSLIQFSKNLDLDLPLINAIPIANNKFKKTPFVGTRE